MKRRGWVLAAAALLFLLSWPVRHAPSPTAPRTARAPKRMPPSANELRKAPNGPENTPAAPPAAPEADANKPADPRETSELLLILRPNVDAQAFARAKGLTLKYSLVSHPTAHVFAATTPAAAAQLQQQLLADPQVAGSFLNERTQFQHCDFVPNDPYFPLGGAPGFPGQWHLDNGAFPNHANVAAAWHRDFTGLGVLIGIVDDCLETAHPDLSPNYVAADSWNFGNNTADPNPRASYDGDPAKEDRHGVSVAGVAAARGGNGLGTTGAAPFAGLAGLRIDFPAQTAAMFYDATRYHSTAAVGPTNIKIKNHSYSVQSFTYVSNPLPAQGVTESAQAGTIHLFAAGNNRGLNNEDSNKNSPQNSPDAIAVTASGSNGRFVSYGSFGSNVFVAAPSSSSSGFDITCTDRIGNRGYNIAGTADGDAHPDTNTTSTFGGTSSATPLAAGIMALGKQARPALNVRFAKHALARSCFQIDPNDNTVTGGGDGTTSGSAWKTNAAGFKFNQNYGFGLIDADQFVTQLLQMDGVGPMTTETIPTTAVNAGIPENNPAGISRTFNLTSTGRMEEIVVTLVISHGRRGQLEATLTSPSGTTRRLFIKSGDNDSGINWPFLSNEFWGESPTGTWTIRIVDTNTPFAGTWNSYAVTARIGTELDSTPPSVVSIVRGAASPTNASSVPFTVKFTEPVTGLDASDFAFTTTGTMAGASITSITGGPRIYTVTVNTGTGDGALRLDLADNDSIQDGVANKLGGAGVGNGSFSGGETYTFDRTSPAVLNVTSMTPDGAYKTGPIPVIVTFAEPVLVTGVPQLRLATGGAGTLVNYSGGSGTTDLTFTYTIASGHNTPDLDCFSTGALTLNGGTIKDAVGNNGVLTLPAPAAAGSLGANKNLLIDTAAPTVPGQPSGTPNPNTGSFTVSWAASSDGTGSGVASYTVQRSDNGGAFATIATGVLTTSLAQTLAQGSYTYQVLAIDNLAQASASSAVSSAVLVDSAVPAAPSIPDLLASTDSGTFSNDDITNLNVLTLTGTAEPGSTVQLFVDGAPGATAATAADGTWSIDTSPLAEGVHSFTARQTDGAGNTGPLSGALQVAIDRTPPPMASVPDLDAASDSGSSSTDDRTKLTTLTVSGTVSPGLRVVVWVDGVRSLDEIVPSGIWTLTATVLLPGEHLFQAAAFDVAGNTSGVTSPLRVFVDTTPPAAPSTPNLTAATDTGPSNTDNITSVTTPTFTGFAEPGSGVKLFAGAVEVGNATSDGSGNWTITSSLLAEGTYLFTATATDLAGNTSPASGSLSVKIDKSAPSAPSTPDLDPASDTGTSDTDNLTKLTTLTFTGTAEDGSTVRLLVDNNPAGTGTATGGAWSITVSSLAAGVRSITATSVDGAGNVSAASGALLVTIDTTPPLQPAAPTLDAAGDTGASSTDAITTVHLPSFGGTTEAGAVVRLYAGVTEVGMVVAGPTGDYTAGSSNLADGAYAMTVTATDAAGNVSPASASLALIIDNTAPPAGAVLDGVAADIDYQNSTTTLKANWSGFADPQSGILKYEVAIGTTPGGNQIEDFVDVATATSATRGPFTLSEGVTYYVTVRATNPVNLQSTATSDGVTIDTIAPAPAGSLLAIPGDASATLIWTLSPSGDVSHYRVWWKPSGAGWGAATVVDNLPGPSASLLGLTNGVLTNFKLVAVDVAGNESSELFASATPQPPVQIQGGGTYATIQDAIDAAGPGQTVVLGPGTYDGDLVLHPGVSLLGWAPGYTFLNGTGTGPVVTVQGALASTISQLTITGGSSGISSASADLTIHHVVVHHVTGPAITAGAASALTIFNVTLMWNGGDGVFAPGATAIRNTIAGKNGGVGFNTPGSSVTYSDAYGNTGGNYSAGNGGGTGNTSSTALFESEGANDYRTTSLSPTADAGDPADDFSQEPDPNGGRIDMGAFGNTSWSAPTSAPPPGGTHHGGGGGGGCGLVGIDGLALVGLLALLRRRRGISGSP